MGMGRVQVRRRLDMFMPFTLADQPPQGNDAKCGLACHMIARTRDYVFTGYGKR